MPGLVPGIHLFFPRGSQAVDGRAKPGHDGKHGQFRAAFALIPRSPADTVPRAPPRET